MTLSDKRTTECVEAALMMPSLTQTNLSSN